MNGREGGGGMSKRTGAGSAREFRVTRDHWADHRIYFGANVHVSKVFEREKLSGRIVGLSEYKYLILEIPLVIGHRARYTPGSTVIVKLVREGTVYGFYSEVLQLHYDPAPVMYLKYPGEVESFEFRSAKRFICNVPARMYNDNAHYYCLINDISAGGCNLTVQQSSLKGDEHIDAGEDVKLLLNLYGLGELELDCHVRSVKKSGGGLSYGVQFDENGKSYALISKYLDILCC
jgi:c-di-GMP-binding flagellar brake protein YcgR